ncbi:MAG: tetratricopeptide repeat protein [Alphaproteobacteria bacterium]|nr:tetratricopeptide repeat protein [Alphaproteobacteria bacterium]
MSNFKPDDYWKIITEDQGADIDLALTLISLYSAFHDGMSVERYVVHIFKLAENVSKRFSLLLEEGAKDDARTRLAALKYVLYEQENYVAYDNAVPDILESYDLIRCIDERKAHPGILALLYLRTALSLGWKMEVLSLPDLYICRLIHESEQILFDPADLCGILEAHDLRARLKVVLGENAELSASYYEALKDRDFIVRLLNPVKNRYIEAEDYRLALKLIEKMRELVPQEFRLLFDSGVLNARIGETDRAINDIEAYIANAPNVYNCDDAKALLHELKASRNKIK